MEIISNSMVSWFTKEHLVNSLLSFLRKQGFRAYKEESAHEKETIIFAIANGSKQIIQVNGYVDNINFHSNNGRGQKPEISNLVNNLQTSLLSLCNAYSDIVLPVSLCLPYLPCFVEMFENIKNSFREKNLNLNIYMVKMEGNIISVNLNQPDSLG